ncbi:MAG: hypothetical protein U1F23_00115 [Lysobacterales bacterium]
MTSLRTTALLAAIAVAAALASNPNDVRAAGDAQPASGVAPPVTDGFGAALKFEGTWDEQITFRNCDDGSPLSSAHGQNRVIRGGAFVATTMAPPTVQGPGLGNWWYDPPGLHYVSAFRHFMYNPGTGAPTGWQIVERDTYLSNDGNSSTGDVTFGMYDLAGNQTSSGCATTVGTRILE